LRTSLDRRLLTLTLDRPERRNALSAALCTDLVSALEQAAPNPSVGAILIEAEGPVFCAGMDLDEALSPSAPDLTAIHERLFNIGAALPKPLIAAVHGNAFGGGIGLIANAHIAIAADTATFSLSEIKIGLWPFVIWRSLIASMGERRSVELALTARTFTASDALAWGLLHQVVPASDTVSSAREIAVQLSQASAIAVSRGLELARRTRSLDPVQAGQLALQLRTGVLTNPDFQEGVRAFREKRAPKWPSLERPPA
jgi:enoyl-CoA hydratase/carnithine racemase